MKVTNKLIAHLANLSKLDYDLESTKKIKSDLNNMLNFVNKLSKIKTKNIEPLIYLSDEINTMRADEIDNIVSQKEALMNAPKKDSDYFKVPTILKKTKK